MPTFGGTCLNIGCIPSKALLHASELFQEAGQQFRQDGHQGRQAELDLPAMMAHKDQGVGEQPRASNFCSRRTRSRRSTARPHRRARQGRGESRGRQDADCWRPRPSSSPPAPMWRRFPASPSTRSGSCPRPARWRLPRCRKKLLVVGAGVIGLELGSVWRRLGTEVTVVEFLDRITPGMDGEVGKPFQRMLQKQGMTFQLSTKVTGVEKSGKTLKVTVEPAAGGAAETHRGRCGAGRDRPRALHRRSRAGRSA